MKRYLLFGYSDYYPDGGWHDFIESFDTLDEAKNHGYSVRVEVDASEVNNFHVFDIVEKIIVYETKG